MNKDLAALLLVCLAAASCAHTDTHPLAWPLTWQPRPPPDGQYEPDHRFEWYAGEQIRIQGTHFHYTRFHDVVGVGWASEGTLNVFPDHVVLNGAKVLNPYRISGLLTNHPVLWTQQGFEQWTNNGSIDPMEILYLSHP